MSAYEALKGEIRRLARKEAKALIDGSTKATRTLRKQVGELKQQVAELKREVAGLKRGATLAAKRPSSSEALGSSRERITAKGVVSLRARLGISQGELGALCGVSSGAVSHWEAGRTHAKGDALSVLLGLRGLGKKEVRRRLDETE